MFFGLIVAECSLTAAGVVTTSTWSLRMHSPSTHLVLEKEQPRYTGWRTTSPFVSFCTAPSFNTGSSMLTHEWCDLLLLTRPVLTALCSLHTTKPLKQCLSWRGLAGSALQLVYWQIWCWSEGGSKKGRGISNKKETCYVFAYRWNLRTTWLM